MKIIYHIVPSIKLSRVCLDTDAAKGMGNMLFRFQIVICINIQSASYTEIFIYIYVCMKILYI